MAKQDTEKQHAQYYIAFTTGKEAIKKELYFNYKLAMIQRNSTTPEPQELSL